MTLCLQKADRDLMVMPSFPGYICFDLSKTLETIGTVRSAIRIDGFHILTDNRGDALSPRNS